MSVLDASALIALLRAEPGADTVRDILQDCIAAVTAQQRAEGLVTSDRVLATVARSAGIDVVAFRPGSSRSA